ncbi:hypothetical protein Tco_0461836 [Tanacetum coccineum]
MSIAYSALVMVPWDQMEGEGDGGFGVAAVVVGTRWWHSGSGEDGDCGCDDGRAKWCGVAVDGGVEMIDGGDDMVLMMMVLWRGDGGEGSVSGGHRRNLAGKVEAAPEI